MNFATLRYFEQVFSAMWCWNKFVIREAQSSTVCLRNTQPFNGPLSGTTRVSRYQKGKANLDLTEASLHLAPDR